MTSDSSYSPTAYSSTGRKIILLLDGTRQRYSTRSTNVFRLYAMLRKGPETSQVVYYQPGIGTADKPRQLSQITDLMFAHTLKSHLIAAYKFVVNNCKLNNFFVGDILTCFKTTTLPRIKYTFSVILGVVILPELSLA